ncbi:hypothetical protein AHF37_11171 [Paragonimus kellicotti]|nr:hypothetical protein AHF37_11171 [Paragonimus kellicotti]
MSSKYILVVLVFFAQFELSNLGASFVFSLPYLCCHQPYATYFLHYAQFQLTLAFGGLLETSSAIFVFGQIWIPTDAGGRVSC